MGLPLRIAVPMAAGAEAVGPSHVWEATGTPVPNVNGWPEIYANALSPSSFEYNGTTYHWRIFFSNPSVSQIWAQLTTGPSLSVFDGLEIDFGSGTFHRFDAASHKGYSGGRTQWRWDNLSPTPWTANVQSTLRIREV